MQSGALGKKILFLYPAPVLTEVVEELARREFEVYLVRDHNKVRRFLNNSPDSVLFVNLDDGLEESAWEIYLKEIKDNEATSMVGLGVLSMNDDAELKQKYLMDLQLPCGYITLKIGAAKSVEILAKTLEVNEARGRRKFVRALCPSGTAQCIVDFGGETLRGEVSDFSSAGVALDFSEGKVIKPGTVLRGIQLAVKGGRVIADGFVAAHRAAQRNPDSAAESAGPSVASHVIMFDPSSLDDVRREKLRSLVFKVNQASFDRVMESL